MALEEELFEENTSRRYKRFLSFFLISSGTVAVRTRGKGLRGFTSITEIRRGTYNGGCSLDREWKRSYPLPVRE